MISVTELRAGTAFKMDGQLWIVLKYDHTKMGRGTATIKVKARNLKTGTVLNKSFISGARVEDINTVRKEMTYLYAEGTDGDLAFMDPRTFEQITIDAAVLGEQQAYLKEGENVFVLFYENGADLEPLTVDLPPKMTFTVTEADPGVKGDSAANMLKQVVLENGIQIKAPLFIKVGEKIRVDTRTGEYVERANDEE